MTNLSHYFSLLFFSFLKKIKKNLVVGVSGKIDS